MHGELGCRVLVGQGKGRRQVGWGEQGWLLQGGLGGGRGDEGGRGVLWEPLHVLLWQQLHVV